MYVCMYVYTYAGMYALTSHFTVVPNDPLITGCPLHLTKLTETGVVGMLSDV